MHSRDRQKAQTVQSSPVAKDLDATRFDRLSCGMMKRVKKYDHLVS